MPLLLFDGPAVIRRYKWDFFMSDHLALSYNLAPANSRRYFNEYLKPMYLCSIHKWIKAVKKKDSHSDHLSQWLGIHMPDAASNMMFSLICCSSDTFTS